LLRFQHYLAKLSKTHEDIIDLQMKQLDKSDFPVEIQIKGKIFLTFLFSAL